MSELSPAPLLLFLLSASCASLAHLLWGKRWRQLFFFWLVAFAGCLIVYAFSLALPLDLPHPAGVPVLESVILAWVFLSIASRLRV
jgi:hypothetical protein